MCQLSAVLIVVPNRPRTTNQAEQPNHTKTQNRPSKQREVRSKRVYKRLYARRAPYTYTGGVYIRHLPAIGWKRSLGLPGGSSFSSSSLDESSGGAGAMLLGFICW